MDLPRVKLPPDCESCPACRGPLSTDGQSILCDNGHLYLPEEWSTKARRFVIEVWRELKGSTDK